MKTLITNYTFAPSTKKITFTDYPSISLNKVLLITNTTSNTIIYNFANNALGGTVSGNVLTLTYNTTSMGATDAIQIYYDDIDQDVAKVQWFDIKRIFQAILRPIWYDPSLNRVRETAVIESGTVTTVSTVTTCSTVTGITDVATIGSYQSILMNRGANISTWALSHRARIS